MKQVSFQKIPIKAASALGAAALSAMLLGVPKKAEAQTVVKGSDYWITQEESKFDKFPEEIGPVYFKGNPIGTFNGRDVGDADTIVRRIADVIFDDDNNDDEFGTTEVAVVALSLISVDPVTIGSKNFDVFVDLTEGIDSTGSLTIHENNMFDSDFTVNFTATFVPVGGMGCPFSTWDCRFNDAIRLIANGKWSSQHPGGPKVEGEVGDIEANVHTNLGPDETDFFPVGKVVHNATGATQHVVSVVPEPITILGSFLGAGGLVWFKKRRNKVA